MAAAALMVGLAPAVFIGWGLGMPLGLLLRPVRNQWLHVAAVGRLSVWTFVRVHDDVDGPGTVDDGGPPAAGTEVPQPAARRRPPRVLLPRGARRR
jgi:hypothetical protein